MTTPWLLKGKLKLNTILQITSMQKGKFYVSLRDLILMHMVRNIEKISVKLTI